MSALDIGRTAAPLHAGSRLGHHARQLPVLLRLVRELDRLESVQSAPSRDAGPARDRQFVDALRAAARLLSIGRLKTVLGPYLTLRGIAAADAPPYRMVEAEFERAGGARRLEDASRTALELRPRDGNAHYVRRLCREQIGHSNRRDAGALEPEALRFAAGWVEAAEDAAASGDSDLAERRLRTALEIDPNSAPARRRYAALMRRRDPIAAGKQFAAMLEQAPRLPYGVANLVTPYRGFLISFEEDFGAFIAQPAFLGVARLRSLRPLLRRRHRLLGLMAMRIHLARRLPGGDAEEPAEAPGPWRPPGASLPLLRAGLEQAHQWLAARPDLLRFILKADSDAALRWQIDQVHRIWLTPGDA